jgi:H+/Cl- antiporter ClcA
LFDAISKANRTVRLATIVELFAGPLIALIFLNDLPGRQPDVVDMFLTVNRWSVLYFPIPLVTALGLVCGGIGVVQTLRAGQDEQRVTEESGTILRGAVLCLPFLLAAWNIIALCFVGFIPEIV